MAYKFPEKFFPKTLNSYIQCPFKFKAHCDSEIKAKFVNTPQNYVGKVIHAVLRDFFDITNVPINKRKEQNIEDMVRKTWARIPKDNFGKEFWGAEERIKLFGSPEQERAFGMRAIATLKNYLSKADLSVIPLFLEDWVKSDFCDEEGKKYKLAGRIDRIDQDSSSSISVWDYKTGKLPYYNDINKIISNDVQLPIYALLASKLNPFAEKIRVGLIYVSYSKVYSVVWDRRQLNDIKKRIISIIKKIENDKEFLPRANKLCPWCEYRNICPLWNESKKKSNKIDEVDW